MRTIILLMPFLVFSVGFGGEEGFKSSRAKAAKKKFDKASEKAKKEYDKKITSAKKVYKKDLGKALKEAMKKGNLDEANKIKETKDRLITKSLVDIEYSLYVSPGNSAKIYHDDKLIGTSSQWGQLIPIKFDLKTTKIYVETHNTDGVSWVLIDNRNRYISGNSNNTMASIGKYDSGKTYTKTTTGMHWVNDSLYKRIDITIPKQPSMAYKMTKPIDKETYVTFEITINKKEKIKIRK